MNEILMAYGREGMRVPLDPAWQVEVIRKPPMPGILPVLVRQ